MDKGLENVYRGFITDIDIKKDGDYEPIGLKPTETLFDVVRNDHHEKMNITQIGTISGVFKYWVNKHEIQWHNKELVNKSFGAILKGDKFKLSVKIVSQEVLNTLPKGDYEFKNLKATVIGFYYKENQDTYGTSWLELQYVYELCTDYVFTIVATEQYINGYRLLTFYPNVPFIEGTEYIKEIDPDYALINKDSRGNVFKDNFHLQDLNFHDYFKVFKDDEYIDSSNFKNINNPISFLIYSNNKYNYYRQYIRSLIMNPIGLQYSIDIYDIGYTQILRLKTAKSHRISHERDIIISDNWEIGNVFDFNRTDMVNDKLSELIFSGGKSIPEMKHERYDDIIAIDDKLYTNNGYIPVIAYKYYYFTTKDTFLGKYLDNIKIQKQDIIKKDFGCNVYYVKDKELITTTLSMKSCMEIIYAKAEYLNGSSCMIHKFILNNKTFYVVDRELVYILNCLTTGQVIDNLSSFRYNDIYLKYAIDILNIYNFEPIYESL